MNNIVIIDDCATNFSITGIAKMLVTLEFYYEREFPKTISSLKFFVIIPNMQNQKSSATNKSKANGILEKSIKSLMKKRKMKYERYNINIIDISISDSNSSESLEDNVERILSKLGINPNLADYSFLVDLCLSEKDQEIILKKQLVTSSYLYKTCLENNSKCFVYTQYPPNQIVMSWNESLKKLLIDNNFKPVKIYYRGDINGEARFNKSLANQLI